MSSNETQRQLQVYEEFFAADPENGALCVALGNLYLKAGRAEQALVTFQRCPAGSSYEDQANSRAAAVLMSLGRPGDAQAVLQALTDRLGPVPVLVHNLGVAMAAQGQWEAACDRFALAHDAGYHAPGNSVQWIRALEELGRVKDALAVAQAWVSRDPGPYSLGVLAMLHLDAQHFEQAERLATQVIRVAPMEPHAVVTAASCRLAAGDVSGARMLLNPVVERDPRNGRALLALGLAQLASGDVVPAVASLERCCAILQRNPGAWVALGWAVLIAHGPQAAEQAFLTAVEVNRTFGESHGGVAVAQALQGRAEEAEERSRVARRLLPEGIGAKYADVILLESRGLHQQAQEQLDALLDAPPGQEGQHPLRQVLARNLANVDAGMVGQPTIH